MKALPTEWKGCRVAILGLARSGLALARVLTERGAQVLISDQRLGAELGDAVTQAQGLGVRFELGGHSDEVLDSDVLIVSPGVSLHAPLVRQALQNGVIVTGEVEIAYRFCPRPLVAVTGTNGKSTTCSLLHAILGHRSRLAGNIGVPLVAEVTGDLTDVDYVIAEISSFQLETTHSFRPYLAVLTNITPDHLDRHKTMDEYIRAKARLFAHQGASDIAIFNADDANASRLAQEVAAGNFAPWSSFPAPQAGPRTVLHYSAESEVEWGAWFQEGSFWVRLPGSSAQKILDWDFENLPGPHNLSNALAATLAAHCLGATGAKIAQAFAPYRPMHHRLETVASLQGVRFVDDSKATNVSSVESALLTYQEPIVLIAGGRDKGLNLEQLGESIARHCHALIGIGEAGPRIVELARERGLQKTGLALSMDEAVRLAHSMAPSPGVVLLSPACTSFDMFRNAEHRGDEFVASVHRWIENSLEER